MSVIYYLTYCRNNKVRLVILAVRTVPNLAFLWVFPSKENRLSELGSYILRDTPKP